MMKAEENLERLGKPEFPAKSSHVNYESKAEKLIHEFVKTAAYLPPLTWKRVRFVVTLEEYAAIKDYLFKHDGLFAIRIKGIPLVIEDHPENPETTVEFAPAETQWGGGYDTLQDPLAVDPACFVGQTYSVR